MKLMSFEINNFRSIEYLKCYVSSQITILAGKNESGKTSILLALEKFKNNFEDSDIPISSEKDDVSVVGTFEITDSEIKSISEKYSLSINPSSKEITVKVTFDDLEISGKAHDAVKKRILEETEDLRELLRLQINEMRQTGQSEYAWEDMNDLDTSSITHNISQFSNMTNQLQSNPAAYGENITIERVSAGAEMLQSLLERAKIFESIQTELENSIPNIIYFDSFEDKLISEMDLQNAIEEYKDASKTTVAKDFIKLSKLDLEKSNSTDSQHRKQDATNATEISSEMFGSYWKQDPIRIIIDYDGPNLTFFIQEQGKTLLFKPSQRSKGIQWFMCFLARLFTNDIESKNNLILIDEPGLYLHSRAQQDVLKILEDLSSNSQIIFSTHSPYLIEPDKLDRIRLVIKTDDKGTIIHNNFSKDADVDTMSPIYTAIGLDLSKGISFSKKKNIIVEGISDYYYLTGMKIYLKETIGLEVPDDLAIIPCVGESKIQLLASIFTGYGLDFKMVFDSKGTTETRNKLKNDGFGDKILIIGSGEESIEDLFDRDDFDIVFGSENKKYSKTIISKLFLEKIQNSNLDLSEITISKFEKLFKKMIEF